MRLQLKHLVARTALVLAAILPSTLPSLAAEALQIGQTFLTSGLDPTKGSNGWALVSHGIGEQLFTVDKEGQLVPELAESADRTGDLTWRVRLKPGRFFSDGTPVSAQEVARALSHTMEANKTARATGGTLTFQPEDPLTLTVVTERRVPVIAALFAEWPLIVYRFKDDGSALFSGPYQVREFKPDQSLALSPNPHYPESDRRSDVMLRKLGDAQSLALAFEAGDLDLAFGLPAEAVTRLKTRPDLTVKSFSVGYQYFAFLNTRRPLLADARVRQAIDLAIDRREFVAAIRAGSPATGAFAPYFPFAVKEPRPNDLASAARLLDQAGWSAASGGVRTRDGQPLKVAVLAYPQRPDLVTMQPVVKAQLGKIGIGVETRVVENASAVAAAGDFDILLWAQHTAPSGDPAFFLNSTLRTGSNLNYAGYSNSTFDTILDRLSTVTDPAQRNGFAIEAQGLLFRDVPVSFLISPEWFVGVSNRLKDYEPWGSDYHVLRAKMGEVGR
jgi:peptide/nickel transport system substrate-binding protein